MNNPVMVALVLIIVWGSTIFSLNRPFNYDVWYGYVDIKTMHPYIDTSSGQSVIMLIDHGSHKAQLIHNNTVQIGLLVAARRNNAYMTALLEKSMYARSYTSPDAQETVWIEME